MVGLGLYLAGAWQRFAVVERVGLPLWRRVEPLARRLVPVRDASTALALGALWGWMPCGLVYAALGLALNAGSAGGGALAMVAFGLGTLPMLMTMGALAARIAVFLRVRWVRRTARGGDRALRPSARRGCHRADGEGPRFARMLRRKAEV